MEMNARDNFPFSVIWIYSCEFIDLFDMFSAKPIDRERERPTNYRNTKWQTLHWEQLPYQNDFRGPSAITFSCCNLPGISFQYPSATDKTAFEKFVLQSHRVLYIEQVSHDQQYENSTERWIETYNDSEKKHKLFLCVLRLVGHISLFLKCCVHNHGSATNEQQMKQRISKNSLYLCVVHDWFSDSQKPFFLTRHLPFVRVMLNFCFSFLKASSPERSIVLPYPSLSSLNRPLNASKKW